MAVIDGTGGLVFQEANANATGLTINASYNDALLRHFQGDGELEQKDSITS